MSETLLFSLKKGITSPTFIATADIHLGKRLYNEPELEEDLRDNLSRLVDLAIQKKVKYVVEAGDTFEDNFPKPHIVAFVSNQVQKLKNEGIQMIGIAGDHDKPLKNEAWYRIAGIVPVSTIPEFAGFDYFDYSSVDEAELIRLLKDGDKDTDKVLWVVLHCQFPQVYNLSEPKKIIDFNKLNLFEHFPNLQGIIAGDLHFGPETRAYGVGHEAYVGYPGSLGQTDIGEAADFRRVFYCDGHKLQSIPFKQRRKMIRIDFRDPNVENFDVSEYMAICRAEKYKPVLHIAWDRTSEKFMHKVFPLYEVAIVHPYKLPVGADFSSLTLTDREEVSTEIKIEKALRDCFRKEHDEDMIQFSLGLITSADPKSLLDEFKSKYTL